eukprot:gene5356-35186_t
MDSRPSPPRMPERKGLVNGVITLGFGLGAFCFNFLMTWYLNPLGCQPVCGGAPYSCEAPAVGHAAHHVAAVPPVALTGCASY